MIKDFENCIRIRELLTDHPHGLSISEIARELSLHRTTVSKYLDALQMKGEVELRIVSTAKIFFLTKRLPASSISMVIPEPYLLISRREMVVGSGNAFHDLLGVSEKDMTGKIFSSPLFLPLQTDEIRKRYRECIQGISSAYQTEMKIGTKEGWYLISFLPVVSDEGSALCLISLKDRTEEKYAEDLADIHEEKPPGEAEDQNDFIFRIRRDGILVSANAAFCAHLNKKREELIGFPFEPLISGEESARLQEVKSRISPEEPVKVISLQTIRPDGMISHEEWKVRGIFTDSGRLLEFLITAQDISRIKGLEEELAAYHAHTEERITQRTMQLRTANKNLLDEIARRESIERELMIIQFVFDQASDSIILFTRSGEVYRANETSCALLGYTQEEIAKKTVFTINPEISQAIWEEMWRGFRAGGDAETARALSVHRRKDGSIIPVELSRKFIQLPTISLFCSIARKRDRYHDRSADIIGIRPEVVP